MKYILLIFCLISFKLNAASLIGDVNEASVNKVIKELSKEHKKTPKNKPLVIVMNSGGGNVYQGYLLILEIIKYQRNDRKVNIIALDLCASMCFTILQAATVRIIYEDTEVMQHPVSGANKTIRAIIEYVQRTFEANRMGVAFDEWDFKASKTIWFKGQAALEYGAVDVVLKRSK